jgi:hypothetical protein
MMHSILVLLVSILFVLLCIDGHSPVMSASLQG